MIQRVEPNSDKVTSPETDFVQSSRRKQTRRNTGLDKLIQLFDADQTWVPITILTFPQHTGSIGVLQSVISPTAVLKALIAGFSIFDVLLKETLRLKFLFSKHIVISWLYS